MEKKSKRHPNQAKTSQSATSITPQQFRQAAATGNIKRMEKYLAAGGDINAQGPTSGRTALHQAFRNEQKQAANFLMRKTGVDIHIPDNDNVTAADLMIDIMNRQPTKTPEQEMLINIHAAKQQLQLKTDERELFIPCKNMCTCIDLAGCVMLLHIPFVKSIPYACWHYEVRLAAASAPRLFSSQQRAERTAEWKQHTQTYPGTTLMIGPNATSENLNLFEDAGIKTLDGPINVIFNPKNCQLIQVKAGVVPEIIPLIKYLKQSPQPPAIPM